MDAWFYNLSWRRLSLLVNFKHSLIIFRACITLRRVIHRRYSHVFPNLAIIGKLTRKQATEAGLGPPQLKPSYPLDRPEPHLRRVAVGDCPSRRMSSPVWNPSYGLTLKTFGVTFLWKYKGWLHMQNRSGCLEFRFKTATLVALPNLTILPSYICCLSSRLQ